MLASKHQRFPSLNHLPWEATWVPSQYKDCLIGIGIQSTKLRLPQNSLIFIIEILISEKAVFILIWGPDLYTDGQKCVNPCRAEFIWKKKKNSIVTQNWHGAYSWNPSLWKTRTCIVNTTAANDLWMQGSRASAAIVLNLLSYIISVSSPDGLSSLMTFHHHDCGTVWSGNQLFRWWWHERCL